MRVQFGNLFAFSLRGTYCTSAPLTLIWSCIEVFVLFDTVARQAENHWCRVSSLIDLRSIIQGLSRRIATT